MALEISQSHLLLGIRYLEYMLPKVILEQKLGRECQINEVEFQASDPSFTESELGNLYILFEQLASDISR